MKTLITIWAIALLFLAVGSFMLYGTATFFYENAHLTSDESKMKLIISSSFLLVAMGAVFITTIHTTAKIRIEYKEALKNASITAKSIGLKK